MVMIQTCTGRSSRAAEALVLSGSDWRIQDADSPWHPAQTNLDDSRATRRWIAATVPGNIQADLESAHVLEPLWYGAGDPRLSAVARKDWWYRKDFKLPQSFAKRRLGLIFDGVDHQAEIRAQRDQTG